MLFEFSYSDFTFKNCLMATRVEGTSVINGPKRNKGPICNNFWTQA